MRLTLQKVIGPSLKLIITGIISAQKSKKTFFIFLKDYYIFKQIFYSLEVSYKWTIILQI